MLKTERDHHGRPVPDGETDDTVITVWEIYPAMDSGYDHEVVRCYQDAVARAKEIVAFLMDDLDREHPLELRITTNQMTLGDYRDLIVDALAN